MKNKYAIGIVIIAWLLIGNSCGKHNSVDNYYAQLHENEDQTSLRWLGQWYGEGKKELLVREMARDFMFLNQDIDVDLKFAYEMAEIDSFADPFRHVADSIVSWVKENRWPFDIFVCDKWIYDDISRRLNDPHWGKKNLIDFQNEGWFKKAHKDYVLSNSEYTGNFGDIAPGAFIEGMWDLLFVSSNVEKKLGIKAKNYNMTIDDFIEYAKIVYRYNQSNSDKITLCATNYQKLDMVLEQIVMSEIGNPVNVSTNDQLKALSIVYKKIEALSQYKPLEQYHQYATDRELKQDDALFHLHATWATLFWRRNNPEGEKLMSPCEFPSMPNKAAYSYSGTYNAIFAIPKNAKKRNEAVRLMKYMSTVDIAEKWENYSKCPTGLESRMSLSEFGTDDFSNFSKQVSAKYNNRLDDYNLAEDLFGGKQSHINFHLLDVAEGEMTASQAINSIKSQMR